MKTMHLLETRSGDHTCNGVISKVALALVLLSGFLPQSALGGVVANCTDADLRTAVAAGGVVTFACDGVIVLTNSLVITASDTILDGTGHTVVLSGGGSVRHFVVNNNIRFTLRNLAVVNGFGTPNGGAMQNDGLTQIIGCTFSNNTALGSPGLGGAIYGSTHGQLSISRCTFLYNRAVGTNGVGTNGITSFGGAIDAGENFAPFPALYVTNSTFYGNSASNWGAIRLNCNSTSVSGALVNSTFSGNTNGGVYHCGSSPMTTLNCIFSDNHGPNSSGLTDLGFNVSSDASGFTNQFSVQNVDPRLAPPADNGGGTWTMALSPDSPAIDFGGGSVVLATDERGTTRPYGASIDSGAYEFIAGSSTSGVFHVFSQTNFIGETGGSVAFSVFRTGNLGASASVKFATSDGTAISGLDYVGTNVVLTFSAGQASNSAAVIVLTDALAEGYEYFHVALSDPTGGATLGRAAATIYIQDANSAFQLSTNSVLVAENGGSVGFTVSRAGNLETGASVNFSTASGSALAGFDYVETSGVLNFAPGQTSAGFTVAILDDNVPEPTETFTVQLSNPTGGSVLGTPGSATVTIQDNDPAQPGALQFSFAAQSVSEGSGEVILSVERTAGTNGVVSVNYVTANGSAVGGSDFVATNGILVFGDTETRRFIHVPILQDAVNEASETFSVVLLNPSGGATLGATTTENVTIVDNMQILVSCDENSLRTAVGAGGRVQFNCDGTIYLTTPLQITGGVSIDGTGHQVSISGNNASRIFVVQPGASLSLRHIGVVDGIANPGFGAGPSGRDGYDGVGAAVCNSNGVLLVEDCSILRNVAIGGNGSPNTFAPGTGGMGRGGAIYNWQGHVALSGCLMVSNRAVGGYGGLAGQAISLGGESRGGAICNDSGFVNLVGTILSNNASISGQGKRSGIPYDSAAARGGAIFNRGQLTLSNSRVSSNLVFALYLGIASGGAIYQAPGSLSVVDSSLDHNVAHGGDGLFISTPSGLPGGPGVGGGISGYGGAIQLTNSTLAGNVALGGAGVPSGVGLGQGGGLYTEGPVTALNCTFSANLAQGGKGRASPSGTGEGGGVYFASAASAALVHVTIAGNGAKAGGGGPLGEEHGGGIASYASQIGVVNSIIANSTAGSNWFGSAPVDMGHNISSDHSCNFTAPGSLNDTDPHLGPLTDYGGPTLTMGLLAGSPAIDAATAAACPSTDQRGRVRPFGSACDIGAFESSPPYLIAGQVLGFLPGDNSIRISIGTNTVSLNGVGQYSLSGLASGSYLIVPTSRECLFVPVNRLVNLGPDIFVNFDSYRTNALIIQRAGGGGVHMIYAGAANQSYRVLAADALVPVSWLPFSTNTTDSRGLFEFDDTSASSRPERYFQVVRP